MAMSFRPHPALILSMALRIVLSLPRWLGSFCSGKSGAAKDFGDVDQALRQHYDDRVSQCAKESGTAERAIRHWFNDKLITPSGIRGQVLQGVEESGGLDNETIGLLVNAHLVRAERRGGARWYELSHDRLLDPVRDSNEAWFERTLHPLQKGAALWERQQRRIISCSWGSSWKKRSNGQQATDRW